MVTDMKSFFTKDFFALTSYQSKKRYKGRDLLKQCLAKYVTERGISEAKDDILFTLGAIICPKDLLKSVDLFFNCPVKELPVIMESAAKHVASVQDLFKRPGVRKRSLGSHRGIAALGLWYCSQMKARASPGIGMLEKAINKGGHKRPGE